jgi:hypothetical protein
MIEMGLAINQVFDKPVISSVFKNESGQIGFSVVRVLSKRFLESFGFSTKLSDVQIDTLTVDILEFFQNETLEDIILFFKMARSGKFGTTNRGVDSNLILGTWAVEYLELKCIERENIIEREKKRMWKEEMDLESIQKVYKKLSEKTFVQKVEAYVDRITKDFDRQMLEDLIIDWEKDPQRSPYVGILKKKRTTIRK